MSKSSNKKQLSRKAPEQKNPEPAIMSQGAISSTKTVGKASEQKNSSSIKKAGNNLAENFRPDINYIKSVINSISVASSKFAKQEDIRQLVEPLLETGRKITNVESKLDSCLKQGDFLNVENQVFNKVHNVQQDIKNISKSQKNFKDETTTRLTTLETKLKSISDNTEMIQSLPGKIDDISQILADKGLELKQDFPVINHEEETLAELADCGEKILQQLAIAARWYARKLPELKKHESEIKNLTAANEKAVQQARKAGEEFGRKAVIKELLKLYDNLQSLMNPIEGEIALEQIKVLKTFLSNNGVEPIYQLREELEITDANLMNYKHNIANIKPGKIVITSPGYTFDSKTIEKAKFISADEFSEIGDKEPLKKG